MKFKVLNQKNDPSLHMYEYIRVKGMVKFPGKGHFKRVTTGEESTLNVRRQAKRAFLNTQRQA